MYRNLSRLRPRGSDGMKGAIWKDYGTKNGRNDNQGLLRQLTKNNITNQGQPQGIAPTTSTGLTHYQTT